MKDRYDKYEAEQDKKHNKKQDDKANKPDYVQS